MNMQIYQNGKFRLVILLMVACVMALSCPAYSKKGGKKDTKADPDLAKAIKHFEKGVEFFDEGNYNAALAEFLKSYELVPNPALRYNIGVCYYETGNLADALDQFENFLAEKGDEIKDDLKKEVERLISKIEGKIGYLLIKCDKEDATVTLDGYYEYTTPFEEPVALVPGFHRISVRKSGFETVKKEFSITSGEKKIFKISLKPEVMIKKKPVVTIKKKPEVEEEEETKEKKKKKKKKKGKEEKKPGRWLWMALGGVGALGVVAAVTGGMSLKKRNDMRDEEAKCENTTSRETCPKAYDLQDEGKALMITSNVFAGVAAAVAITGMALFIVEKRKSREKQPKKKPFVSSLKLAPVIIPAGSAAGSSYMGFEAGFRY